MTYRVRLRPFLFKQARRSMTFCAQNVRHLHPQARAVSTLTLHKWCCRSANYLLRVIMDAIHVQTDNEIASASRRKTSIYICIYYYFFTWTKKLSPFYLHFQSTRYHGMLPLKKRYSLRLPDGIYSVRNRHQPPGDKQQATQTLPANITDAAQMTTFAAAPRSSECRRQG